MPARYLCRNDIKIVHNMVLYNVSCMIQMRGSKKFMVSMSFAFNIIIFKILVLAHGTLKRNHALVQVPD